MSSSSKAKAVLLAVFSSGPTKTAIGEIVKRTVSRATELGIGKVKVGHVQEARK